MWNTSLRAADKKVSYRKQVARQHVAKMFGQAARLSLKKETADIQLISMLSTV